MNKTKLQNTRTVGGTRKLAICADDLILHLTNISQSLEVDWTLTAHVYGLMDYIDFLVKWRTKTCVKSG